MLTSSHPRSLTLALALALTLTLTRYPMRLDDGRIHHVRLSYSPPAGGAISVHIDGASLPLFTLHPIDLRAVALDSRGAAIAGFTASSGDGDAELAVEVHEWRLSTAEMASAATRMP